MPLKRFTVMVAFLLLSLVACQPKPQTVVEEPGPETPRYLVGAHYYTWFPEAFDNGFLRDELDPSQEPVLGRYTSWSSENAARHIEWASAHGIDFFTLDYWSNKLAADVRLEHFLQASNIGDIQFCVFYETGILGFDPVTTSTEIGEEETKTLVEDMERIADQYFDHPQYLRVEGRPVVVLYISRTLVGDYKEALAKVRARLKEKGHDVYLVGDEVYWFAKLDTAVTPGVYEDVFLPQVARIKLFDALTAYNFYHPEKEQHAGYGAESTFLQDVKKLTRDFSEATDGEIPVFPSVIPGYNDRGTRLEKDHYVIPRQWKEGDKEGSFLAKMIEEYALPQVDKKIPIMFVTSWNEWSEDTAVEPLQLSKPTSKDSSGKELYTQGASYSGFGMTYLKVIRDRVIAVSGTVVNKDGEVLVGLPVSAWKDGKIVATDHTNSAGRFSLSRLTLPPGSCVVGARFLEAVHVEVKPRETVGADFTTNVLPPAKPVGEVDLKPRFAYLTKGMKKYLEEFPKEEYQIFKSGGYDYYVDTAKDAIKDIVRAQQPWEPHVQDQLREYLSPGDVVLDIGAHIGTHTTLIADLIGPHGTVYAFEPQRKMYRELVQNLRLNGIENAVALRFALGSAAGIVEMNEAVEGNEGGTGVGQGGDLAEMRTLDSFNFRDLTLVKLDVEGYEDYVLQEARETFARNKPILLLEIMGGSDYDTAEPSIRRKIEHTWGLLATLKYRAKKTWHHDYLALPVEDGPDRCWLDVGTSKARPHLKSGFSVDERVGRLSFVWSEGIESEVSLPLERLADEDYALGIRARGLEQLVPIRASFFVNGTPVGYLDVVDSWGGFEMKVPRRLLRLGKNKVKILYGKTGRPSHLVAGNTDSRPLALTYDLMWLVPDALPEPRATRKARTPKARSTPQ